MGVLLRRGAATHLNACAFGQRPTLTRQSTLGIAGAILGTPWERFWYSVGPGQVPREKPFVPMLLGKQS